MKYRRLSDLNELNRQSSGVLTKNDPSAFDYSDGKDSESYLTEILESASDLSSTSAELEEKIKDWPSEYHLSGKRANILRHLALDPGLNVLELGCGCGAISRYMGDQGHFVDAIEGSRNRSEIAALRCRGLDRVDIVCCNFNELEIPEDFYDVVLLIGVTEYAGRFWPEAINDEEAVVQLLGSARRALKSGGFVIVAIENRTGMKYVMGAHEDHYSQRYIGVHNYAENSGTRTYTRGEWGRIVSTVGFSSSKYLFPFPDYKVPTVVLSEEYSANHQFAYAHIESTQSRDYRLPLHLGEHETMFWEAAASNGTLPEYSNSFLILLGDSSPELNKAASDDFVYLPNFERKNPYSVITRKRSHSNQVERHRLLDVAYPPNPWLTQTVKNEPFIEGALLSIKWSRSLLIDPMGNRFRQYLSEYYSYLETAALHIDLVPKNIIAGEDGAYHPFDVEWETATQIGRDYVYFRALLLFALRYGPMMKEFTRWHSIFSIREFIIYGFGVVKPRFTEDLTPYIEHEARFQKFINRSTEPDSVVDSLDRRIDQVEINRSISAKLYWHGIGESYSEQQSLTVQRVSDGESTTLVFDVPAGVSEITHVRFDPCDELAGDDIGFLQVSYCKIEALVQGERKKMLLVSGSEQIATCGTLSGIVYHQEIYGEVLAVVGDNPEIEFLLPECNLGGEVSGYRIEVECTYVRSTEYRLVRDRFLVQEEILNNQIRNLQANHSLLQAEVDSIKSSKLWNLVELYRSSGKFLGK